MKENFPPLPVRILLLLIILGAAGYFGYKSLAPAETSELAASGTIEATIVNLAPELAGRVAEVFAQEAQAVAAGDPILQLDPNLLSAQREVAAAAVDSANAALASARVRYDQALQVSIAAQDLQFNKDLKVSAPADFTQPGWYFGQAELAASARLELDHAQAALDDANSNLQTVLTDLKNSQFLEAEKQLSDARAAFLIAEAVKKNAEAASESAGLGDAANDYYEDMQTALDDAQQEYEDQLTTDEADDVEYARGKAIAAQQRYYAAYARWLSFQTGEEAPAVVAALQTVEQAQTAVDQANANLVLIDTQLAKLTVYSPMDGVILTRNVEPGEFVQPGATALTMADLSNLTITVYVPEDLYGQISLGQAARVNVDSFPGATFDASVVHISDQAEFTPRNVQTIEGRSSTVYAIKLKVSDPEGRLKIGMPADVVFQ